MRSGSSSAPGNQQALLGYHENMKNLFSEKNKHTHHLFEYRETKKQTKEGDASVVNQHHLKLLKKGGESWNTWRTRHPERHPHLPQAILSQAQLCGTDLSFANLHQAVLSTA